MAFTVFVHNCAVFVRLAMRVFGSLAVLALAGALAGCAQTSSGSLGIPPRVGVLTTTGKALAELPPAAKALKVAVYEFPDLTGQNKPNSLYADFSRAITQGATAIVADAMKTAGSGTWFNVVERSNLESLLRERKLIQDTYHVLKKNPDQLVSPLNFAEYILTGAIVSFDAPISSASLSGTYSGIGGQLGQTRNLVTINMRLVRVKDGSVIKSINVSRPIVLTTAGAGANTYPIPNRLLTADVSITFAEATQIAVRECIETGIYELAREGLAMGLWSLSKTTPKTPPEEKKSPGGLSSKASSGPNAST